MTDRPITFSAPMVRALLDGRKAQTRRALKPPYRKLEWLPDRTWRPIVTRPVIGDRLWVREAWAPHSTYDHLKPSEMPESRVFYLADGGYAPSGSRTRPSMFMPRWASRLTLTVRDVRVQRLREISEADAIAEGMERCDVVGDEAYGAWSGGVDYIYGENARGAYRRTWELINGPGSWDANPWVAAYTFDVVKANIDQTGETK